ncbi:hypothetical protein L486_02117 [Kwoniella mangroviensis CBS 10435]|uniref:Uncharacterized protein n=1 Tax=Kwoniella mangroviensis CBS 10435 TaxID=1331196 RepID=A0A1B9IV91_9TREE|nr:hypothetical protein L486_02117 [Kwoniella mangroviensis CBS 10435]
MNNIQQVIDSCSDENWKDILNDPRSKSLLDKSIQSIEITLDMSGSYFRGVNGEQISLEYFNEGFKCRFNPSSEGSAYGDGMARFTLRINFPGKLGTKGSEKSDFQ